MNPFLTDTKLESLSNNNSSDNLNPFSNSTSDNLDNLNPFSNSTSDNLNPFSNSTSDNLDPFSNSTSDNLDNLLKENEDIELWVGERGRKYDTYISHLPYSEAELASHLKNLKKKLGCGGSIQHSKSFEPDESINGYFRIHIQGNHKNYVYEYFTKQGIKNIKIKG